MKINQDTYFLKNDIVKIPRHTFPRNHGHKTTFNMGKLVPCYYDEVIPGDSFNLSVNCLLRLTSPQIKPPMDDLEFCMWFFFVPNRLVEQDWEKIIGNYKDNPDWSSDVTETTSKITIPTGGFATGSVANHFGIPAGRGAGEDITALPFRGYGLIFDRWFRDENLQNTIMVDKSNNTKMGSASASGDYMTTAILGGAMCPVNKRHDYFTSCLPAPQKGAPIEIPLGDVAPVIGDSELHAIGENGYVFSTPESAGGWNHGVFGFDKTKDDGVMSGAYFNVESAGDLVGITTSPSLSVPVVKSNLVADLASATSISVNDLRYAFQSQIIKEVDARCGNRYNELLMGHFGVRAADARLQIPEFLGKISTIINSHQVVQSSSSTDTSPQANLASFSQTTLSKKAFVKSFVEHGYVIGVMSVRVKTRTYSQGLNPMWKVFERFDFYWPALSHIGEQPVKNYEIYLQDKSSGENDEVFGYQEAWARYRYYPNICSGKASPDVSDNLAVWNYADKYDELPTLSSAWMVEGKENLDRTLAISSELAPQFMVDMYFKNKATRPLPIHSIPGLIDHRGGLII